MSIDDQIEIARENEMALEHDIAGQLRRTMQDVAERMERQADINVATLHAERPPKFPGDPTLATITQSHLKDMARELRAAATRQAAPMIPASDLAKDT